MSIKNIVSKQKERSGCEAGGQQQLQIVASTEDHVASDLMYVTGQRYFTFKTWSAAQLLRKQLEILMTTVELH